MLRWLVLGLLSAAVAEQTELEELRSRQAELEAQLAILQQRLLDGPAASASEADLRSSTVSKGAQARRLSETMTLADVVAKFQDVAICLDYLWLLVCGSLVMFMQAGFAILECGSCRAKNGGIVLTKNVLDACLGTLIWYLIGYGFAYGAPNEPNEFIGTKNFAGTDFLATDQDDAIVGTFHYKDWFFQWAFCATAATIVSGAVAERIEFLGYVIYSVVMTGVIYPVIVWWTWSGNGFLTNAGYSDFAGSGIVHLTGGISALVGAAILGAREGRWTTTNPHEFDPHNMGMVVLGTFILWFGWYGFNCGSTLGFSDGGTATTAALVAMNTTIAAAFGGLTVFVFRFCIHRKYDLAGACNGILVGLVAICAGVDAVEPHAALLIAFVGALAHEAASAGLKKLKVDDPLDAFAVHGAGGTVGVLLRPLLDRTGANGEMFGAHCLALVCIVAWSGGISGLIFGLLKVAGLLRVTKDEESAGADEMNMAQQYHSPPKAYEAASAENSNAEQEKSV